MGSSALVAFDDSRLSEHVSSGSRSLPPVAMAQHRDLDAHLRLTASAQSVGIQMHGHLAGRACNTRMAAAARLCSAETLTAADAAFSRVGQHSGNARG
jgi:hypothetical protein